MDTPQEKQERRAHGQNHEKGEHRMSTEENKKALVRRGWEEHWNKGNSAVVDEFFAPNFVGRNPSGPPTLGPEAHKQLVLMYRSAFPDLHVTIEDQVAVGEKVVSRFTSRGPSRAPSWAFPQRASR
jgi:predicted ester cyclase